MPALTRVLETALYVDDVDRAVDFYRDLFEFDVLFHSDRAAGLDVCAQQVLLLFRKGATLEAIESDGGTIPPHDGDGNLHMAFAIPADALAAWEGVLAEKGIDIEARYHWPRGGHSVYFRDPDGHLIELVTPGCWATY
jgi:catechol 2,3-dioxygenase-like lactoylglutathione lyase family enzyme